MNRNTLKHTQRSAFVSGSNERQTGISTLSPSTNCGDLHATAQVVRALRARYSLTQLPVIAIAGRSGEASLLDALEVGGWVGGWCRVYSVG